MCYLCEQEDDCFDYACCEDCGDAICFDVPDGETLTADGVTAAGLVQETKTGETGVVLKRAERYKAGIFCVDCNRKFLARSN